jgi:putative transposase
MVRRRKGIMSRQPTSWKTFLRSHAAVIAAADFFTTEVWTARGLVTHYTLFAIDHATRAVEILGTTTNPTAEFMKQIARNVTEIATSFRRAKRYLIIDRNALYCDAFKSILRAAGVRPIRIPASSPNCNSIAERFVLSIKSECLNRFEFFGIKSMRRATAEFVAHYLSERNHQGIGDQLIAPTAEVGSVIGRVRKKERLGGLRNFYHRAA